MKFLLRKKRVMMALFLIKAPLIFASGLPVIDLAAEIRHAQQASQMIKELQTLKKQLENAKEQLNQAKQMVKDSEGHYGVGKLINGSKELKDRIGFPDHWQAAKSLSGGNNQRYKELMNLYQKNHKRLSVEDFKKGGTEAQAKNYDSDIAVNRAATVGASYTFNNINTHLKNIHQLSGKIESSKNTKASEDLNARMQAEVAYTNVEILRQITVLNQQIARSQARMISSTSDSAKFNTIPESR